METSTATSRRELITIVMLGLAALLTAWSSFQASLWDGVALDNYAFSDLLRGDSSRLRENALSVFVAEQSLFLEYTKAARTGDTNLATYIKEEVMSERLKAAVLTWENTPIAQREDIALSDTYGYSLPTREESDKKSAQAAATIKEARNADRTGDKYSLTTVLFAGSLFLAGLSSTIRIPRLQLMLLSLGALLLVSGSVWLTTLRITTP